MSDKMQTVIANFDNLDQAERCARRLRHTVPELLSVKIRYRTTGQQLPYPMIPLTDNLLFLAGLGQANAGSRNGQVPYLVYPTAPKPQSRSISAESRMVVRVREPLLPAVEGLLRSMGGRAVHRQ